MESKSLLEFVRQYCKYLERACQWQPFRCLKHVSLSVFSLHVVCLLSFQMYWRKVMINWDKQPQICKEEHLSTTVFLLKLLYCSYPMTNLNKAAKWQAVTKPSTFKTSTFQKHILSLNFQFLVIMMQYLLLLSCGRVENWYNMKWKKKNW